MPRSPEAAELADLPSESPRWHCSDGLLYCLDSSLPSAVRVVRYRPRTSATDALQRHSEPRRAVGGPTAPRSIPRGIRTRISCARPRFDLLEKRSRGNLQLWYGARADRLSKPMAKRDRRKIGRHLSPRTPGPHDCAKRAAFASATSRIHRLLQRRTSSHPAARCTQQAATRASTLARSEGCRTSPRGRTSSSLRLARSGIDSGQARPRARFMARTSFENRQPSQFVDQGDGDVPCAVRRWGCSAVSGSVGVVIVGLPNVRVPIAEVPQ